VDGRKRGEGGRERGCERKGGRGRDRKGKSGEEWRVRMNNEELMGVEEREV
jgi:hypothetical protein